MAFFDEVFSLYSGSPDSYLVYLVDYLEKEKKYISNNTNKYSVITSAYLDDLLSNLGKTNGCLINNSSEYKKRDMKYNDFVEAYRLIKYQYSKYSNVAKSLTEGVYSTIVLEILRNKINVDDSLSFLDCGCGPSRITYELSDFYKNSNFTLLDFSLINLYFAYSLISSGINVRIPTRQFDGDDDCCVLDISAKQNKNVKYRVFNMDNFKSDSFDKKFDVITAVHSINLLTNPIETITQMSGALKKNGILLVSDLLGWKENRENDRRIFYSGDKMRTELEKIPGLRLIHYENGGPYCEWVNDERYDMYINHMFVLKKQ